GRHSAISIAGQAEAEAELAAAARLGARYVASCEAEYPPALAASEAPPPLLCVKGAAHLLQHPTVAIVGARNASAAGIRMARDLAHALGQHGLLIASGLARGIDTAAHSGALESGTAAVLAGGIDVIYPPQNEALHHKIGEVGVLICELPPGAQPQARHFPQRNRIISGISLGVIVIEAAPQSGSLITARFAGEQGREVFVVPGSPLDPRSRGGNALIRQGATLVQTAEDVMEALQPLLRTPFAEPDNRPHSSPPVLDMRLIDRARPEILEMLGPTPVEIDELVRQSGLGAAAIAVLLLELDLAGRLERLPGQRVALLG
ncbi:MAG: DNA-processing protein DprA, partial [Alphaproteobacteria bacterium]